jgi:transposase
LRHERAQVSFGMQLTDDGWTWKPFWSEYGDLVDRYNDLVKRWKRAVSTFNAGLLEIGRPLAASDAQVAAVLRLHKHGKSLRTIADETFLSLRTVRTIVDRKNGTDRSTKARRQKIEIDKYQRARWKASKRTGDSLPKRVEKVIETGNALVTEAKGLGRAR